MRQHKTIDRRKVATDAASVAKRLDEQKRKQERAKGSGSAARTPAANSTEREHKVIDRRTARQKQASAAPAAAARAPAAETGSYYSPRQYGTQESSYAARVNAARTAMEERGKTLRASQTEVQSLQTTAQKAGEKYKKLKGKFRGETAGQYEQQLMDSWTAATKDYSARYQKFQKELEEYRPYEDSYNAAVAQYRGYMAAEQAEYDAWRGTIRDADTIRAEQKELKSKRSELQMRMLQANEYANNPMAAPGIQASAAENEARIQELQAYLGGVGEREKLLQEELQWSEHFRYEDLRQNQDFAEKSQYVSSGEGTGQRMILGTGQVYGSYAGDRMYELVNGSGRAAAEQFREDQGRNNWGHLQFMTDDEVAMYNYLYATQGKQGAAEYLEHLRLDLTARQQQEYAGILDEMVRSGGAPGAVLASGASLLLSPFAGMEATIGQIGSALAGREIDPNAGYNLAINTKNALRESVSGVVEENFGPVGSFFYGTGMSMADMLADAAVGGPAAMALLGSRAFSEEVIDAKNRGLSNAEAIALGANSALAEALTERIGLDEMLHLPAKWKDAGFWKGALRGAIGEAGEEGLTNIFNLAADLQIAGDQSEFMRSVHEKMEQKTMPDGSIKTGMSREEATKEAVLEALQELGLDVIGGGLSGGAFGGYQGWKGKRAAAKTQQETENAANSAADAADTDENAVAAVPKGFVDDGAEAADSGTNPPDNTTDTVDNANRTIDNKLDGGNGPALGSLKEVALNSVNPLRTGVLHTALTQDIENRVSRAETDVEVMEATAAAYGVDTDRVAQVRTAMELTGVTRVMFDAGQQQNGKRTAGWFDRTTRVIHLDPEAKSPQLTVYGHEMTHRIEQTNGYKAFSKLVLERMEDTGTDLEQLRAQKQAEYAQGGKQLTDDGIDREIVAQYAAENLLSNEADIRVLVQRHRTLGQRIRGIIDHWLAKFGNSGAQERQFLERARDLYVQALNESDALDEEGAEALRLLDEEDMGGDAAEALREGMDLMLEDDKGDTVKKQIAENQESLNNMEPVSEITIPSGFWRLSKTQKQNSIIEKLRPTGYKVERSDLGVIEFVEKRLKSAFNYLRKGSAEEAVFEALPMVLKKGIEISRHTNHKGREYGTVTIAAPIVVNGKRGNMAAVVKCTTGNLYKVHRVLSPDGSVFVLPEIKEEAEPTPGGGVTHMDPLATPISSASDNIIQKPNGNVKQMQDTIEHPERVEYALENTTGEVGAEIPEAAKFSKFVPTMPPQVQRSLKIARNELVRTVGKALGISSGDRNGALKQAAEDLNNEYIANDVVSKESIEAFWDQSVALGTKEPTEEDRAAFDEAVRKLEQTQERATRYLNELYTKEVPEDGAEEESRTPPPLEPEKELTPEEAGELMKQCKQARSQAARLERMAMLRESDKEKIRLLLRGEIQTHELDPAADNVEDILEVYEARKEYEALAKQVRQYKGLIKKHRTDTADKLTETVLNWKDKKSGFSYSRETMERNVRDIVGSERLARQINDTYFAPVHKAEAAKLKFKKEMRARIERLNISTKVAKGNTHSESYAVQFLGEALSHIQVLKKSGNISARREGKTLREWEAEVAEFRRQNPKLDETSIRIKIQEFRKIYDELLDQVNTVRIRNGYEPVNRIEGYFPHFQMMEQTGFWGGVKKALGFRADITPLPTTINGRTAGFKPGIRWMANAQERTGFQTTYDAIEGFERYLSSAADVIYLTDCIQNLRTFAEQIRYNASPEGLRKQIDRINANPEMDEEQRKDAIERVYKKGKFAGSHFVAELDEYTNLLAGKRSAGDREMERLFGRGSYNIAKWAEQRTGANMVGANISSALTNFIPMTQGFAVLESKHFFRGMADTMRGEWKKDGFRGNSTFLTNRMGDSRIARTALDKASEKAGWLMEWIDMLSAETITRGRYYQNLSRGMSELSAMDEADAWAAGLMGDRSKGGMPTLFEQTNPVAKLFTQFQLEVNNQFSFMLKDIPRDFEDEVIKNIALFLLKWVLGQYLFNDLYERFIGRRPAFDVGNLLNEFVGDLTGYELPNTFELIGSAVKGEELNFETEKESIGGALTNLVGNVAKELPFTPAANLIGIEIDGGRVPVASAIPDLSVIGDVIGNKDWSWKKRWKELSEEAAKPLTYLLPPFGGGQAKKAAEALGNYWNKGRYTMDADGNLLLQFPMSSVPEAIQAALFGSTSTDAGREWVEEGFGSLGKDHTSVYRSLTEQGMNAQEAYELLTELRSAEKTLTRSESEVQRDILRNSGLTGDQLGTVYSTLFASSDRETAMLDALRKSGADMGAASRTMMDIKDADALLSGAEQSNTIRSCIMDSGLTEAQKREMYRYAVTDEHEEKIEKFREVGLDFDEYLIARNQYSTIDEQYEDQGDKATAFARWVNKQGYTAAQKAVVRDVLKYWERTPANSDRYDAGIEAGLSDEDAYALREDLKALEPLEGEDDVKQYQKWRVAVDSALSEDRQLQRLQAAGMNDAAYAKCEALWDVGVAPAAYVRAKELESQFNEDGKGTLKNKEWTKLIDSITTYDVVLPGDTQRFHLTNEQKSFLWQVLTGSESTRNNPWGSKGGEKWLDIKEAMKEEEEE